MLSDDTFSIADGETVLFANGCSMCYGSELFDDPDTRKCYDHQQRFATSWPGILGKELAVDRVVNLGYPGGSNDRIFRTTIAWILENWQQQKSAKLFVVIGWTSPMRREFFIHDEWRQLIPYQDYTDPEASLLNRAYRETAWSDYESAIRFGTQVATLQTFLQAHNIPYLFFDSLISFAKLNEDSKSALNIYLQHIESRNYLNLNEMSAQMSSQLNSDYKEGQRHPDRDGHAYWGKYLKEYIISNNLFPPHKMTTGKQNNIIYEGVTLVEALKRKSNAVPQPSSSYNFDRMDSSSEANIVEKKKPNVIMQKIRKALSRDPFIYE